MSLRLPTAADITSLQLTVLDANGRCDGPDASGGSSLIVAELEIGVPETITVSSGQRTFSVLAFDGSMAVARGCVRQTLDAGGTHTIAIPLVEYDGGPDAGVDAMPLDAGTDGPTGPDVCDAPGTITLGTAQSGTLGAEDDHLGSCGGAGGTEAVFELTLGAPARIRATVTRTSGDFDPVLYLRDTCTVAASEVAGGCVDDGAGATEVLDIDELQAGTYYLLVDGVGSSPGDFDLLVEELPVPPENDRCPGSISLVEGVVSSGTTVDARDDTQGSCSGGAEEVFYDFTLTAPRRVVLDLSAASTEHTLYLQKTCGDDVAELGCAVTSGGSATLDLLDLAAGTYTVVVESGQPGGGTFDLVYNTFDPVPNDTCSSPTVLASGVTSTENSSVGANDDETGSCDGGGATPDIVYSYTLTESRQVDLSVSSDYDAAVSVRSGSCVDEAAEIQCVDAVAGAGTEMVGVRSQAAGTYYVVIDGVGGSSGHADVTLTTSAPPPPGDWCPEAVTLPVGTLNAQALSSDYADDAAGMCGGSGGRDRVYEFTFFGDRQVDIDVVGNVDHVIYLLSGGCEAGTEEACSVAALAGSTYSSNIHFDTLPGGTYYVVVDAVAPGSTGLFDITLDLQGAAQPPPNDTCGAAEALAAGLSASGTLEGALDDSDASCATGIERDVFYEFTLTSPRSVTVLLTSSEDTALRLMSDCSTETICVNATGTGEQLDLPVLEAGTYYLAVDGVDGAAGGFSIGYTTGAPRPANDHCSGAITLDDGLARIADSTVNAIDDTSGSCSGTGGGDVAYTFTIPSGVNRRARVTVSNASGFDPVIYARAGSCTGTEVGCAQTGTGSSEILDMPDLPPGDYTVWIDAAGAGEGTFDILLELMDAVPPPGNDTCAAPNELVAGVTETHSTVGATDDYAPMCLAVDSRDTVHQIDLASAQAVLVTLTPKSPEWNLAAALRTAAECETGPEVSCIIDRFWPLRINQPDLAAGSYNLIVDGESGAAGDYDVVYEVRPTDTTFGYWQLETTGTYQSIANTAGATQRTIPLTGASDLDGDEWSLNISLPFTLDYFGTGYTSVNVHANNYLTFAPPPTGPESWTNDCPLDGTEPNDMIALFWGDGISTLASGSELWTRVDGSAPHRRMIIEYKNWDMLHCEGNTCHVLETRTNQQAILYENGDIEFHYGPRQDPMTDKGCLTQHLGCASTIGIEGQVSGSTDVDQLECNVSNTTNGRVVYYVHPR